MAAPPFIHDIPVFEIRDGIVHSRHANMEFCTPLRIFRIAAARANQVLAEYDARSAQVVQIRET